ncbi:uncharacterized protein [Dysidea avara]|uniref:uncharacterized protein isoform X2 n=1 Tax=Dysidea avara TaxID=196820 RepID=UPI00332ACD4F
MCGMDILLYMMFYERPSIKRIFSESEIIEQDHFFAWRIYYSSIIKMFFDSNRSSTNQRARPNKSPRVVRERSPIELVEVGPVGASESRPSQRCMRSEGDCKPGGDKPPDYEHALNYCKAQADDPEPSLVDDAPPPPTYVTVV